MFIPKGLILSCNNKLKSQQKCCNYTNKKKSISQFNRKNNPDQALYG